MSIPSSGGPLYCGEFSDNDHQKYERTVGLLLNIPIIIIFAWIWKKVSTDITKWFVLAASIYICYTFVKPMIDYIDSKTWDYATIYIIYFVITLIAIFGWFTLKAGETTANIVQTACSSIYSAWIATVLALFVYLLWIFVLFIFQIANNSNERSNSGWVYSVLRFVLDIGCVFICFFVLDMGFLAFSAIFGNSSNNNASSVTKNFVSTAKSHLQAISITALIMTLVFEIPLIYKYIAKRDDRTDFPSVILGSKGCVSAATLYPSVIYKMAVVNPIRIFTWAVLAKVAVSGSDAKGSLKSTFNTLKSNFFKTITLVIMSIIFFHVVYYIICYLLWCLYAIIHLLIDGQSLTSQNIDKYRSSLDSMIDFLINEAYYLILYPAMMVKVVSNLG